MFQNIKTSLCQLYLEDKRPWLVGFSGGKDSTMLASLIFDVVLSIPAGKGINVETLRRMVAKVEEYNESHRAHGLPGDLLKILKDDLENHTAVAKS
jgi:3'-phosphoadenosine 5'-phosphosulfate sulfotransferase (PAPS reductase)/FAD synthetase